MSKYSVAEASAPSSSISTQGSGPSTPPEQSINRNNELSGNTYAEKKPLTDREKIKIIQVGINKQVGKDLASWGSFDLSQLINYEQDDSIGIPTGARFFRELLLFVARPDIAGPFDKHVSDGLIAINAFMTFFRGLEENDHFDEWCDYALMDSVDFEHKHIEILAKRYLTGGELEMVLTEESLKPKAPATPWYMTQPEDPFTLTDEQLVEALDRYYPGEKWPGDKRLVATQERMKSNLTWREKERLSLLSETPEQKEKRLIDAAVSKVVDGPNIPARLIKIAEAVDSLKRPTVLSPDTQIQFRLDKVKHQPLTEINVGKPPAAAAKPKSSTTPAKKHTSKPTTTKKKA